MGSEDVELKHFKRYAWVGSLLIDRKHKLTMTICARGTFERIRKVKERKNPHYLQTMCHTLNGDLEAPCKQMSLSDISGIDIPPVFDEEIYEADFESIVNMEVGPEEGYRHCLIAYEVDRFELKSVSLLIPDKDLDLVREISLMDLLQPDFGNLTAPVVKAEEAPQNKDAHSLIKVKAGLKSHKSNEPEKRTAIPAKTEEVEKQA